MRRPSSTPDAVWWRAAAEAGAACCRAPLPGLFARLFLCRALPGLYRASAGASGLREAHGLARFDALRVLGALGFGPAEFECFFRLVGVEFEQFQHAVACGEGGGEGFFFTAVLLVGEVAGEVQLPAAEGDSPALEGGELVGESGDVADGFHGGLILHAAVCFCDSN